MVAIAWLVTIAPRGFAASFAAAAPATDEAAAQQLGCNTTALNIAPHS